MQIRQVGVVGAGVMGTGVAQSLAQASHSVVLVDVSQAALDRARQGIWEGVRFYHFLRRNKGGGPQGGGPQGGGPQEPETAVARITFARDLGALGQVDFVIENVTEKWTVKERVYRALDEICPAHCLFAANTSAIPITQIAATTARPSQVLGIHFMNPVPLKDTVELIRGYHTSEEALETARHLLESMGKRGILVNDSPGFVSNRVLMLMINEAVFLVQESVAPAADVDTIFKECFGHTMGPLETADLIGLDTILLSLEVLYEQFNDSKFRPCPLLRKMVHAGLYGRKSGEGFYTYT
jgi:3-hydroxybutyryl-CoA dehydrogenase